MRILIVMLLFSRLLYGQEDDLVKIMEDQANQEDVKEVEEDLVQLRIFRFKPVNINRAEAEDLQIFPFLSPLQIGQLILYRKYAGDFIDVKELQAVPGWDVQVVRKLIPYITVYDAPDLGQAFRKSLGKGSHQFLLRSALSKNAGLLVRYHFRSPKMEWGINLEKDAGERIWQGSKGISFLSGHAVLRDMGMLKMLVVGDYIINLGQGLSLWQGRAVRKTAMPILVKRQLPLIMPYRSNDENRYFRGVAARLVKGNVEASLFASSNFLDANTEEDTVNGSRYVTSFLNTGYHRDPRELEDKNSINLRSAGGSITFRNNRSLVSANSVAHLFSIPVNRSAEAYNLYAAKGRSMISHSMNVHHTWRNMHFFGELAMDREWQPALIGGVMMAVDTRLDLSILSRRISRGYRAFFANAFTESSEPANEHGNYLGLSFRPASAWVIDAYADHYRFPWIRYRSDAPGWGRDYLWQLTYKPGKKTQAYVRFRYEAKTANLSAVAVRTAGTYVKRSIRFHLIHKIGSAWESRFRFESLGLKNPGKEAETGFLFYSDWFWNPPNKPFSFNARVMICETGSYSTRIYAYENDVMFYNIVPGFYETQARIYINGNLNMTKKARIFFKFSRSYSLNMNNWQMRWQFICDL